MNIDKDIEILKELAEDTIRYKMVETDAYMAGAITRVLKELERLQRENNTLTTQNAMMSERHFKDSGKLKELETWKKIAKKLAEELTKLTEENKEYYLDLARKEVEK